MIRATARIDGDRVRRMSQVLQVSASDRRWLLRTVDAAFRKHEERLFSSQGGAAESTWRALSPLYKARKDRIFSGAIAFNRSLARARGGRLSAAGMWRALGSENKILQLTGDLKRSLTRSGDSQHIAENEGPAPVFRIVLGTRDPKAFYHFTGGPDLPVRNPVAHTEGQKRAYLGVIRNWYVALVQGRAASLRRRLGR